MRYLSNISIIVVSRESTLVSPVSVIVESTVVVSVVIVLGFRFSISGSLSKISVSVVSKSISTGIISTIVSIGGGISIVSKLSISFSLGFSFGLRFSISRPLASKVSTVSTIVSTVSTISAVSTPSTIGSWKSESSIHSRTGFVEIVELGFGHSQNASQDNKKSQRNLHCGNVFRVTHRN